MCHGVIPSNALSLNGFNFDFGVILAMPLALLIMLAPAHFENAHFVVPTLRHYGGSDSSTGHQWRTQLDLVAIPDRQHLVESNLCANVRRYLFYFQFFASGHFVLFATGFYDRVHG